MLGLKQSLKEVLDVVKYELLEEGFRVKLIQIGNRWEVSAGAMGIPVSSLLLKDIAEQHGIKNIEVKDKMIFVSED